MLALALGLAVPAWLPALPPPAWVAAGVLVLPAALRLPPRARPLAWFAAGLLYALIRAHLALPPAWLAQAEGRDVVVEGTVASLVERDSRAARFVFHARRLAWNGGARACGCRLRLAWYARRGGAVPPLAPGQRWRLTVRLKRPRGFANPGGFDYGAWLLQRRIDATGYVRTRPPPEALGRGGGGLHALRGALLERLQAALDGRPAGGLVAALALGERSGIDPRQWEVLRRTGTGHLVAISGLHVGLVAGLAFFLARRLWTLVPGAARYLPAPRAGAMAGFAAAAAYAALAGFSVPTQRALVMVAVAMAMLSAQRRAPAADGLLLALVAVLVLDPLAVLGAGFWLSFGAVAVILWAAAGRHPGRGWRARAAAALHLQGAVALGLVPLTLLWFGQAALVSPLANLFAIPAVGLVAVPLVLGGTACLGAGLEAAGGGLLGAAAWLLEQVMAVLASLAAWDAGQWQAPAPGPAALALGVAGVALLLAPRGLPGRWLGLVLLLPLLVPQPPRPEPGGFRLAVLDVGQGLAAVVETHRRVLVFDAGARFSARFDAGSAVVAPYLRARGWRAVDLLVISHGDGDHAGGVPGLARALPVGRVLAPEPWHGAGLTARPCAAGQAWTWDGVRFEMLGPEGRGGRRNDRSCVLRVEGAVHSALLPGDIEAGSEYRLVARAGDGLASEVLVAPHHGSRTSSTPRFVAAVAPRLVVFPAGWRNRFRFPAREVTARYRAAGAILAQTGRDGAVLVDAPPAGPLRLVRWRDAARRFWHGP